MTRTGRWRLAGRQDAAAGTNLHPGSTFARGGIEADATTSSSPRGTQVISTIPNVFGTGRDAEMSYYELPNGAKVFAAGAFTLAGRAWMPGIEQVPENLWTRLADEEAAAPWARWQRQLPRLTLAGCIPSNDSCAFESSF
jgi:hypothetical protein